MSSYFQVDGIISGLKTTDIISQIMALERRPILSLQKKQTSLQQRTDALRDVATRLTSLKATLQTLTQSSTFNVKKASTDTPSTSPAVVTATASASAASGSFKVTVSRLTSSTVRASTAAIGQPVDQTAPLAQAGFGTTPTTGFFTINGVTITIDSNTTLNSGTNSVVYLINNSGAGVTASVVDNKLKLTSASQMQLGSGADTSNFLTAAKVLAAPQTLVGGDYELTSTGNLGVTQVTASLASARLTASITPTTGKFKINGVEFTYDAQSDSLNKVITRINASTAGVNAAYDAQTDRLVLTAKATGSVGIAVEDVTGNFLAATGVLAGGAETLGQNAEYSIDTVNGGATLYSASNTISGVVPGVTLTLKSVSATPVTVTVEQDVAAVVQSVKAFVEQYNSAISFIREKTAYNSLSKKGELLMGDSAAQTLESRLRSLLFGTVTGMSGSITSLADVGITSGAVGSAPGTTTTLAFDEAKFTTALQQNSATVARLFSPLEPTVSLQAGGTGSIASATLSPSGTARIGAYSITSDAAGNLSMVFTPAGGAPEDPVTGTITAGGTNSTLIAGVTLYASNPLVTGTDVVEVSAGDGVATRINTYLDSLIGTDGVLTLRRDSSQAEIERLGRQIAAREDQLVDKERRLVQKFTALEVALSRLQSQSNQLAQSLAALIGPRTN